MAPPTPPSPTPALAASPDPSPPAVPPSGAPGAARARAGWSLRRVVLWAFLAAVVLVGVYFYFAYARSVTPLRVGS